MPGVDRSASQGSHIHHCFLCMSCYNSKLFTWYKATILPFSKFNIFDISRSRFTKSPFHTNFIKLFFQQKPLSRLLDQGSRAPKSTFHTICTPSRVFLAFTRGRVKWRLVAPRLSQFLSTKSTFYIIKCVSLFTFYRFQAIKCARRHFIVRGLFTRVKSPMKIHRRFYSGKIPHENSWEILLG